MTPALLAAILSFAAQDEDRGHQEVMEAVRPSLVAVRAEAQIGGGERSGTGVFLDEKGLILTSYWIVPPYAKNIRVWTTKPRYYKAEIVGTSKLDEITLIRIKPKGKTTPIRLGKSDDVKIGDVSYTVGNAANSMINDNQPSFNFGIVSGLYNLKKARSSSFYQGWVFETTAAVNEHMEGAPLLNSGGRMIGLVTLNYSPQRFLGNAIPIDFLKPRIEKLKKEAKSGRTPLDMPAGRGYLGLEVAESGNRLVVSKVEKGSPAQSAGIQKGDVVLKFRGKAMQSLRDFREAYEGLEAGSIVWMTIDAGGFKAEVKIQLAAPPKTKEDKDGGEDE